MKKKEILAIFDELLEDYHFAAETVIDIMGDLDNKPLNKEVDDYRKRFLKALNS